MTAEVEVQDGVTAVLGRISADLARGLAPARGPLTNAIRSFFAKRFATGGAYGGRAWPPRAASTYRTYLRKGIPFGPTLVRTGTLWASLTQEGATGLTRTGRASSRAFGFSVLENDNHTLRVGSWDPVVNLLRGTRHSPARDPMPDEVPRAEADSWAEIYFSSTLGYLRALGGEG